MIALSLKKRLDLTSEGERGNFIQKRGNFFKKIEKKSKPNYLTVILVDLLLFNF